MIKVLRKKNKKLIKLSILTVFGLLIVFLIFFEIYALSNSNRVFRNQYVGDVKLAGKSQSEVTEILTNRTKSLLEGPVSLEYGAEKKVIPLNLGDLGLRYDIERSVSGVWLYGRGEGIFQDLKEQLTSIFKRNNHDLVYSIDDEAVNQKIAGIAKEYDVPEKDYSIEYRQGKFVLNTERATGTRINQERLKERLFQDIKKAERAVISFDTETYEPKVSDQSAREALDRANQVLEMGELTLSHKESNHKMDLDTIGGMIKSVPEGKILKLTLNEERAKEYVLSLAKIIDTEPKNSKLTVSDGRAVISEKSVTGKILDQTQARVDISNSLFARIERGSNTADPRTIELRIEIKEPEISDDKVSSLGINELIGTGTTDFRKSPSNRVHNITIGAKALNGVLLKPGDAFSTIKKLGTIDASSGYLEELVIKENQTIPEFGGGLCQVSSTLFRATLNAGLKILERQNHKYRVSYYEPPVGMDATIYDPSPDFKFENNYDKYILIQSTIKGTQITFDLYGTKDGRTVEISAPEMYDVVDPGPAIIIETESLPPGERKKLEKSHQGASAKFNYKVTLNNKVLQEKIFISKYVPWPEKWLVGKGAAPTPAPEPTPSPTPTPEPVPTPTP